MTTARSRASAAASSKAGDVEASTRELGGLGTRINLFARPEAIAYFGSSKPTDDAVGAASDQKAAASPASTAAAPAA